jgi:hypothetical protein
MSLKFGCCSTSHEPPPKKTRKNWPRPQSNRKSSWAALCIRFNAGLYTAKNRVRAGAIMMPTATWLRIRSLIQRFNKLVIPPAYTNVWISPHENGHLQFTGTDAAGRKQYRYHPVIGIKYVINLNIIACKLLPRICPLYANR